MKRFLVVLAACGGSDNANPDAPPMMPGSVSIRVTDRGVAQVNVEVFFQEADSTVKSVTVTDADGLATGDISNGGFVTIVEPTPGRQTLTTFTGVQADDELHLDLAATSEEPEAQSVMMQVELDPGAAITQVATTCGPANGFGVTQPEQVTLFGCGNQADMLVFAADETETVVRSRFHRAQRVDQVVALTGAYTDLLAPFVTYSNLPDDVTFVGAYRRYSTTHGTLFDISVGAERAGATASAVVKMPSITPADGDVVLTSSALSSPTAIGQQLILEWAPGTGNDRDYSLNVGDALVAQLAARPVFEAGSVTWTVGRGQTPNYARAFLAVSRDDVPVARSWAWRIAGAHDDAAIAFPALPRARDGFDFNILDGDAVSVSALTTAKLPAGYTEPATRAHAFGDLKTQIAGTDGQLVIQELADHPDL